MSAAAHLQLVPPPPPIEAHAGQHCFGFVPWTVVAHFPVTRGPRRARPEARQLPFTLPDVAPVNAPTSSDSSPRPAPAMSGAAVAPLPEATPQLPPRRHPALKAYLPRVGLPGPRPRSLGTAKLSRHARKELGEDMELLAALYLQRPKTYGDCQPGPCPWVSCRHHLKLDVHPVTHSVKDNFPGLDVDEMLETCSLRVADMQMDGKEPMPLERVGAYANITMERARQLEKEGLAHMRRGMRRARGQRS